MQWFYGIPGGLKIKQKIFNDIHMKFQLGFDEDFFL